jgi:hypothetical protein
MATGGFHDNQGGLVFQEQVCEFANAFGVICETPSSLAIPKG